MATYTTVDDGYDVDLYKSFDALWDAASGAHRQTDEDEPLYLDGSEETKLTKAALRAELKQHRRAYIYESGQNDWTLKINAH